MRYLLYMGLAAGTALVIIFIVFFIRYYLSKLVDNRIAAYQKDLITKHCDEVQNIYNQIRGWLHDYHNHIQTMKAHLTLGQLSELNQYLGKMDEDLTTVDTILKTGNVMVDAIINSKISLAKAKKISINAKGVVPEVLHISEIDLCVIMGNLLDNAAEACLKLPRESDRFIRVYIGVLKQHLYISVTNSAGGEVIKIGKSYLSTKGGSHGFGLLRVDKIAAKYGGYVNRQNEDGIFATEIMLPL
jgi:two-component system, LytTR family, sensor histidine kinase AgrC